MTAGIKITKNVNLQMNRLKGEIFRNKKAFTLIMLFISANVATFLQMFPNPDRAIPNQKLVKLTPCITIKHGYYICGDIFMMNVPTSECRNFGSIKKEAGI